HRSVATSCEECRSLLVWESVIEPGDDADGRHAGDLLEVVGCGSKEGRITAELVQCEALDASLPLGWKQRPCAEQMSECATPVDVGHQEHGSVGQPGDGHVDDVVGPQVGLGWAACALDHHHV